MIAEGVASAERLRFRTWPGVKLSRSPGTEGTGEFVALRRAWASLKAATEMRCDESLAWLPPRGRGRGKGSFSDGLPEGGLSEGGDVTWRKALRLNESGVGRVRTGGELEESGREGLDFVRARGRAQENKPPLLGCLVCGIGKEVCESGLLMVS